MTLRDFFTRHILINLALKSNPRSIHTGTHCRIIDFNLKICCVKISLPEAKLVQCFVLYNVRLFILNWSTQNSVTSLMTS